MPLMAPVTPLPPSVSVCGAGDLFGRVVDPLREGRAAAGRVDVHLVGVGIGLEQRLLTRRQLVRVLVHVVRGDGEQDLVVRVRIDEVRALAPSRPVAS